MTVLAFEQTHEGYVDFIVPIGEYLSFSTGLSISNGCNIPQVIDRRLENGKENQCLAGGVQILNMV